MSPAPPLPPNPTKPVKPTPAYVMLTPAQTAFANEMVRAAQAGGHIFPDYAAAEACLESAWGQSQLCRRARNVFGLKTPSNWDGASISIPTKEFLNEEDVTVAATWPVFDTYLQAFTERMEVLHRNLIYADALAAPTGEAFVTLVSQHWATDPLRGTKVLQIYHSHPDIFSAPVVT